MTKTPLNYQTTEYDCGPTTLLNAFLYLFDREKIPVLIIKQCYAYTLDLKGREGKIGEGGTSVAALSKVIDWIAGDKILPINVLYLCCKNSNLSAIIRCVKNNGCVIAKCYLQNVEHYILVTDIDSNYVYIFDPYYLSYDDYDNDYEVSIICDNRSSYNRIVAVDRLFSNNKEDFSLVRDDGVLIFINKC